MQYTCCVRDIQRIRFLSRSTIIVFLSLNNRGGVTYATSGTPRFSWSRNPGIVSLISASLFRLVFHLTDEAMDIRLYSGAPNLNVLCSTRRECAPREENIIWNVWRQGS